MRFEVHSAVRPSIKHALRQADATRMVGRGRISRWIAACTRFLNAGLDPAASDPQLLQRARVLVRLNLIGVFLAPVLGVVYSRIAAPVFAWVYGGAGVTFALSIALLRATQRPRLSASFSLLPFWGVSGATYWLLGGVESPVFSWLFILPLVAGVTGKPRDVHYAIAGVAAACVGFWLLPQLGYLPTNTLDPTWAHVVPVMSSLVALATGAAILTVWISSQGALEASLSRARQQAELVQTLLNASTRGGEPAAVSLPLLCSALDAEAGRVWQPDAALALRPVTSFTRPGTPLALPSEQEALALFGLPPRAKEVLVRVSEPAHAVLVQPIHADGQLAGMIELHMIATEARRIELRTLLAQVATHLGSITERDHAQAAVRALAYTDPVCGLPNRHAFQQRLAGLLDDLDARRTQAAMLYIDLNGFKRVNESLGSDAGDLVLREVAERLRKATRMSDHLWRATQNAEPLARFGGDEFTVLLTDVIGPRGAEIAANRILELLAAPVAIGGQEVVIGASIGIAMFPGDAANAPDLIQCADRAMQRAKRRGAAGWERFDGKVDSTRGVFELAADFRRALDERQVQLHYQPIFRASDGALVGAEALARWNHPTRGQVSPAVFVPAAEATGLVERLGHFSLNEACRQAVQWGPRLPAGFRVAVNVSARHFMSPLHEHVREALARNNCEGARIELEMTETALLVGSADLETRLREIVGMGVGLVLDDFGTGYSSLSFLKQFPICKVKIDRGFVAGLPYETRDVGISRAIIAMSHTLGLSVVAEGVEEEEQQEFLASYGCDALQGYLLGYPVPAAEFEQRWLSAAPQIAQSEG